MRDMFRHRNGSFFSRGENSEGFPTLGQLLAAREMDYAVHKQQISIPLWDYPASFSPKFTSVANQHVIRRSTDGEVVSTKTVSDGYGEIAPVDMLGDLDPFVLEGWATPDAAFRIAEGNVYNVEVITLKLAIDACDPLKVNDLDTYRGYIVARNYQGQGAASASLFLERTVSGSLYTALDKISGFKIVHRGQVRDKYKMAMKRWGDLRKIINEMAAKLRGMNEIPMTLTEAEIFVDDLLEIDASEKVSTQAKNMRAAILDAFNMPRYGTFGRTTADMYHGVVWVGSHYTAESSKLSDVDIMESLLEGTRGNREKRAMMLLDRLVAKKKQA